MVRVIPCPCWMGRLAGPWMGSNHKELAGAPPPTLFRGRLQKELLGMTLINRIDHDITYDGTFFETFISPFLFNYVDNATLKTEPSILQ